MSDMLPTTSAMHGITTTQNVSRAVAERIAQLEKGTRQSRALAWTLFVLPLVGAAALAAIEPATLILSVYFGASTMPVGAALHYYRMRGYKEASRLDRNHDVAWVSPKEGLVFFSDEGVFVEKRGGFKPYGVQSRRFRDVTVSNGVLALHGMDFQTGATYTLEVLVPGGWTDDDTKRVRIKLANYAGA
jgi:hypothetical protein